MKVLQNIGGYKLEYFFPMLHSQTVFFLYLAIGFIIRRKNVVSEEAIKGLVNFILVVALPMMIFSAFDLQMTPELMFNGFTVVMISTVITILMIPFGKFLWRRADPDKQAVLEFGTLMPNAGFAGIPLVYAVFGNEAVFFASLFLIPQRSITWSAAISIFSRSEGKKPTWKQLIFIPGNIAVFIGLAYMLLPITLPSVLTDVARSIGTTAPPLSMVAVGCMLAEVNLRQIFDKAVLMLSAMRLIIIPIAVLLILRPFGFDFMVLATSVVLFAMPVGVNSVLLAKQWNGDYLFATRCIFVTSAFSILTAPFLTLLL